MYQYLEASPQALLAIETLTDRKSALDSVLPQFNELCDDLHKKLDSCVRHLVEGRKLRWADRVMASLEKGIYRSDNQELLSSRGMIRGARIGQLEKAVELLERVVQIQQEMLPESSSERLSSEHTLGLGYYQAARPEEALQPFEHVARIKRAMRCLPDLYIEFEQPGKAKEVAVEIVNALRTLPVGDARWREHGEWLTDWKQYFGIEDWSHVRSEYDPDPGSDALPDSANAEYRSGNESDAGLGTQDTEYESGVDEKTLRWKRFPKRILKRDKRKE